MRDWPSFHTLKENLIKQGFETTSDVHRLKYLNGYPIDIIPFGGVSDATVKKITWPPDNSMEMTVLGFEEALEDVIEFPVDEQTQLKVCGPVGLVILKLIAWSERDRSKRRKDAADLSFVLKNYAKLETVKTAVYGDIELLEKYDADTEKIGAYLLGLEAGEKCKKATKEYLLSLMSETDFLQTLATDMKQRQYHDFDDYTSLLQALIDGFENS